MSTEEQARELETKHRQDEKNRHQTMNARAAQDAQFSTDTIDEKARDAETQKREYQKHLQETMHERSNEEIHHKS